MRTVVRANERFNTRLDWLDSWHSFNFNDFYSPEHRGHGTLLVLNDDIVAPGGGFGTHHHANMEIVTWVLSGGLNHRDSTGTEGQIRPGIAQRMTAGTGIAHSEFNASDVEAAHFLQMWLPPSTTGLAPGYQQSDVSEAMASGELFVVASGLYPDAPIHINVDGATMWAGEIPAGQGFEVPTNDYVHVFIALGSAHVGDEELFAGDALRLSGEDASARLAATTRADGAHVVVWESAESST